MDNVKVGLEDCQTSLEVSTPLSQKGGRLQPIIKEGYWLGPLQLRRLITTVVVVHCICDFHMRLLNKLCRLYINEHLILTMIYIFFFSFTQFLFSRLIVYSLRKLQNNLLKIKDVQRVLIMIFMHNKYDFYMYIYVSDTTEVYSIHFVLFQYKSSIFSCVT